MMPGETHPAAPGPAAGLSRCQGCASLQQNLNEYVDALITLKQKIINTDNLLTEYQKKCDELQFARRENSTLHHQVEQMLQKISPLQKCQEELGSLKAELEEKKSSLKLYQDTQQEYTRVKEECLRTDAQKKKLEAKVKKLEEAAVRQTEDFKQLRNEKKILEKEFKKTQERLDEFSKQKNEKELRHIGTQISSDSYGSIDRRKVKLLLKELWLCINAAHRLPGEGSRCVLEQPAKDSTRCVSSGEDGALPPAQRSPVRTPDPQPCLTDVSMELEGDCDSHESVEPERSSRASHSPDRVLSNDRVAELPVQSALHSGRPAFADQQHSFDKDLQAAIDFFKLPPPLLSPVPSPPRMSSPHPGSLPSPPVPETYVEEYTDSSDDDPAQPRTSGESVLDDSAESQDCFGLRRRSMGSGTWDEKPEAQECVQAPNAGQVYQVRAAGLETSAAAPREPSGSESKAESSKVMGGRGRAASREAGARMEVRELDKSVQTEEPVPRAVWLAELCGRLERDKEVDPGQAASCYSALGKRSLKELTTAEPATRFSKVMEPQSESAKWAVTEDVACVSDSAAISHHTRRASGEAAKAAGVQGSEADAAGSGVHAAGPLETRRPSSTSVVQSVRRNPWSRQSRFVGDTDGPTTVIPARLCPSEQTLETTAVNTSPARSEPPGCPAAGSDPESKFHALSSALGISSVGGQRGSKSEGTDIIKGFPHSVFMKATKDGQCESEGPGLELRLTKSDFTSVINSRADSVSNASGFAKSTSWHHSDLLRRSGEEVLPAKSEHARKIGLPLQQGRPSLQSRGSASSLELGGENANPVEFKPAAAQLPNQVSVIMKQTRPETVQRLARSEPPAGARHGDPEGSRAPPVAQRTGEAEDAAARLKAVAAASSSSPEVSTSWKKLDFDSPSGSSLVESVDGSTTSRAAFSSEHIPPQKRDVVREAAAREEVPKQRRFPQAPDPDSSGWEGGGLPPASEAAESGGLPREEMPCGVAARAGSEALAVDSGSPDTPPSARGLLGLKSKTSAFPDWLLPAGTAAPSAFCSKGEETRDAPPGSLPGPLYAYTGIRERGGEAAEAEESEALSCSEGEHEAEGAVGSSQQDASGASPGSAGGSVAEAGASVDVGLLASALEDCTISTLPDIDRLSASDVVLFLESCQLKDCSSGDSVSECSGRETSNREMSQELKQDGMSAGRPSRQPCEEALGAAEEWIESEDDDSSLRSPSPPAQCSLETLSAVLTEMGQELQVSCENCPGPAGRRTPLQHHGMPAESEEGRVPSQEIASSSHAPGVPLASVDARGSSPVADGPRGHIQDRPEGHPGAAGQAGGGEEGLGSASAPEPAAEGEPGDAQAAFQCQISTVTSEVISVLINKDQNLVIEKGDNWTIVSGVSVVPDVGQLIVCEAPEDVSELDAESTAAVSMAKCPDADAPGPPSREPLGSSSVSCTQEDVSSSGQSANFDKSRLRNRPVKPSIWISSQIYDQTFETQVAASDHTYYNSKLEPCSKNKNRSKIVNKEPAGKPAKALASGKAEVHSGEVSQSCPEGRGGAKTQRSQAQPVLANADTSTPTDCSPDTLSKIRQEVGPPLPPLLAPLVATPPRTWQPLSPLISSSSPSSPISPVGQTSPSCEAPAPAVPSPWLEGPRHTSPALPSASPSAASAGERIPSSPLQFCAATPKHALPVPGRLPACASGHATAGAPPQENSVKILDSMYPELSARARTLSLLKGNIRLARGADSGSLSGPVGALKAFKAITSASTAFVKTGSSSAGDSSCKSQGSGTQQESGGKRGLSTCPLRSAKRLCLGRGSAEPESPEGSAGAHESLEGSCSQGEVSTEASSCVPAVSADSQRPLNPKETVESHDKAIADALRKVAESTFDLLPVIRSHVYVGNISKKPVMRDQEKEVVHEFSTTKKHLAECLLHSILAELKVEKTRLEHSYVHALCRVYVGVCRQLGDLERARLFCYSLLKEDFPESEKLTLFIANMWRDVFVSQSVVSHAMQLVARQRARGEVLNCLRAFLGWEKNASVDVGFMISKLLLTIQLCPKTEFQSSGTFGEDLSDQAWEYVFAIDLLCCHQKWIWTHDNIISKELWPVMDKWIKYRKGHTNITYTPDIIIASILRLIGRLGQLGLKEGFPSAVKNISSVIGMFIQHAQDEDIPWGVQLAAVYALCDLSPSNPAEIAKILEAWRRKTSRSIPCAVTSYLEEVSSLSAEGRG